MKSVSQQYVQHINRVHERTGTLWEGRFRSSLVASSDYVLACYRYIELNPVRAGLTSRPEHYEWSSYRCNAEGKPDSLIEAHPLYYGLEDTDEARRRSYRALFDTPMGSETLDEIRSAASNCRPLGSQKRSRGRPAKNRD
jgi:putative transposase